MEKKMEATTMDLGFRVILGLYWDNGKENGNYYLGFRLSTAPPLSNSWIIIIIWLYIALNRTPNIDCYWVGAVPKV